MFSENVEAEVELNQSVLWALWLEQGGNKRMTESIEFP
jgi:hypothetical protein